MYREKFFRKFHSPQANFLDHDVQINRPLLLFKSSFKVSKLRFKNSAIITLYAYPRNVPYKNSNYRYICYKLSILMRICDHLDLSKYL